MSFLKRDIILVTGATATGRTTICNFLAIAAEIAGVPYEQHFITDWEAALETIRRDDLFGGHKHYHPWCMLVDGHTHDHNEPFAPFIIHDDSLVQEIWLRLFGQLTEMEYSEKYIFVVLTAGINTLSVSHPAYAVDRSYKRIFTMLQQEQLPSKWLSRVHAVVHVRADFATRCMLNEKNRYLPNPLLRFVYESSKKMQEVLMAYGKDDFEHAYPVCTEYTIPSIFSIINDGTQCFFESVACLGSSLFSPEPYTEPAMNGILFLGTSSSGKTTFITHLRHLLHLHGYVNTLITDKSMLERFAQEDLRHIAENTDGAKKGPHGQIFLSNESSESRVDCFDGYYLNKAHEYMMDTLSSVTPPTLLLQEYGVGRDVYFVPGTEPLFQNHRHLMRHLYANELLARVLIIDLDAPFQRRFERQAQKVDRFDEQVFSSVFASMGELSDYEQEELRAANYRHFIVPDMSLSRQKYFASMIFYNLILPRLSHRAELVSA
jgi:hypothetical protein